MFAAAVLGSMQLLKEPHLRHSLFYCSYKGRDGGRERGKGRERENKRERERRIITHRSLKCIAGRGGCGKRERGGEISPDHCESLLIIIMDPASMLRFLQP